MPPIYSRETRFASNFVVIEIYAESIMDKKQEEMVSDWRIKRMKTSEKIAENKDWM